MKDWRFHLAFFAILFSSKWQLSDPLKHHLLRTLARNQLGRGHHLFYDFIWKVTLLLFSCSVLSDSLWPHGQEHAKLSCLHHLLELAQTHVHQVDDVIKPSHTLSSPSISSCLQSFPATGSFPVSWLFTSSGQSIAVSASTSVLMMNIQDWSPLGLTDLISLQSKGLSRVFSNTTVQKHQFFVAQPSL